MEQVWKCIRTVQMFLQFVCNKSDNKLDITSVRSFLNLGHVHIIPYSFSRRFFILYCTTWTNIFFRNGQCDFKNIQR